MTEKAYRICVSNSPGNLASDVTGLLSEGWELYGHPFVDAQSGNGNGHAASQFCQAMVRGQAVARPIAPGTEAAGGADAARIESLKRAPIRRVVPVTFRNVAAFAGVMIVSYLLIEGLVFRSGLYARYLEPEASTGGFEEMIRGILEHKTPAGKKEVLLVGSSRIAEGFSAKLANEHAAADGYDFLNAGAPGSGDRVWYYAVRDLDPGRNKYAAIALPVDDYDDPDDYEDVADRASEIRLVVNRLRLTDILPYTLSFHSWKARFEVFRGALLKGIVYQDDIRDFVEHPARRMERVRTFRKDGASWAYAYAGIPNTLAGLNVDYATRQITFPPNFPENLKRFYRDLFFHNPPQKGMNFEFEKRWLGALVDLYKGSKTRIIVYQTPRGPMPNPKTLSDRTRTIVDEMRTRPWVTVIDRERFESLEKPEWFADYVHLNSEGRKIFSPMMADLVKETLH